MKNNNEESNFLEIINLILVKLLTAQSLEELCEAIVEEAKKLVGTEHGAIFLQEEGKFERVYISSPLLEKSKLKKAYLEKAYKSKKVMIVHKEDIRKMQPDLEKNDIKSLITIPLSYKTDKIGLLLLFSKNDTKYTEKQLHVLQLHGAMASLAITKTKMHEETKRALELRDRFISLASHELRTPLTSINGYIQLLHSKLSKQENTQEARWVEELFSESKRMTNLVKDLLDINRIKQGQLAFVLSEVNLKEVIGKAVEKHQAIHPERDIIFEDRIVNNVYTVIGDSEKLQEMMSALLGNAIKFSKPQTKTVIALTRTARSVKMVLRDQGKGIPQKDLTKIFEGFYKTKHSVDKEGMGVGLLLAKHIVSIHRGKMNISSTEHKGTTVEVILPSAKI